LTDFETTVKKGSVFRGNNGALLALMEFVIVSIVKDDTTTFGHQQCMHGKVSHTSNCALIAVLRRVYMYTVKWVSNRRPSTLDG